jgi:hypothetical protein
MPLDREALADQNIGEEKLPVDLTLTPIVGVGSDFDIKRKKARDITTGADDANVGAEKTESDLFLTNLQDPTSQLILTPQQSKSPQQQANVELRRGSTEALLDLGQGSTSVVGGPYEAVTQNFITGTSVNKALRQDDAYDDVYYFQNIDEFEFTPVQRVRYDELLAKGEINGEMMFDASGVPSGKAGNELVTYLTRMSRTAIGQGIAPNGLTLAQAVEIIVGNDREGVSRYNPLTGMTWTRTEKARAYKFAQQYAKFQGFGEIDFRMKPSRVPGGGPNANALSFQNYPVGEAPLDIHGQPLKEPRLDELRNALTAEEMIQVMELFTGRSRRVNDPRREGETSAYADTLLEGDFLM